MTSGPRTVVDCLRSLPPADGLAIADAALRAGICSPTGLGSALDRAAGRPNVAVARRTAALVEPRRESPLESWSALAFAAEGVPAPCWQVDVLDEQGRFVARVDAWWPEGVAGESDGRAKYLLAAEERGGADAARLARVLHEEREREQRLRRLGVDVVRWGARDVLQPDRARALAEHLRARLAAAGRQAPFTGRVR
jgi:hypothetical protein